MTSPSEDDISSLQAEIDAINSGEGHGCVSFDLDEGHEPPTSASQAAFESLDN